MRPRLKAVTVYGLGETVVLCRRALERTYLSDSSGAVRALLAILERGSCDADALPAALADAGHAVPAADVARMISQLDDWGVLERADADEVLDDATRERHASNLRYYDLFSSLSRSSADMHRSASAAHVLLLGAGGLGSGILQSLAGLGVGRVRLVDIDVVEAKNLARQFVYSPRDIGARKVEAAARWARAYAPQSEFEPVCERIENTDRIIELARGTDVVVCAIDSPANIHQLVNEACCRLRVPFVSGGLTRSTLSYWSVDPGRSPCRECLELHRRDEHTSDVLRTEPLIDSPAVNRAAGPVAQLAAGFVAMEALRYVAGTERPVAAGAYHVVELADGMVTARSPWAWHPECRACPIQMGAG